MTENRFLLMDIGAGTLDMLYYDMNSHQSYKAVVMSPVREVARQISGISGNLVITGCEMGGGSVSAVLQKRAAQGDRIIMSQSAAKTIHHDLDRVTALGIEVVPDNLTYDYIQKGAGTAVTISDIQIDRIAQIVKAFGVPFEFDAVAVCAQDHGVAPKGVSHLDYRHNLFQKRLDQTPSPATLLYALDEIPATMSRLTAIAHSAGQLPTKEIFVMDSGMAAILGAGMDPQLRDKNQFLLLDIATSHTVGAAMSENLIDGFFEYHTHDITCERIDQLLTALADGNINHADILSQGGHGAYLRKSSGFAAIEAIIATGPKRGLLKDSKHKITWGAPLGDNMMTGTAGLLEALR
ncbi:MAG: DUF1786 family protein, partial [Desulfobacteraceae bacterium]